MVFDGAAGANYRRIASACDITPGRVQEALRMLVSAKAISHDRTRWNAAPVLVERYASAFRPKTALCARWTGAVDNDLRAALASVHPDVAMSIDGNRPPVLYAMDGIDLTSFGLTYCRGVRGDLMSIWTEDHRLVDDAAEDRHGIRILNQLQCLADSVRFAERANCRLKLPIRP